MTYVDAMLAAVPTAGRQEYLDHAKEVTALFKEHGAEQLVECWGDDIPEGKLTSLPKAVQCKDDETVVLSWITWPSREARNAGMEKLMADPRMQAFTMPFDGKRMIFGGFEMVAKSD